MKPSDLSRSAIQSAESAYSVKMTACSLLPGRIPFAAKQSSISRFHFEGRQSGLEPRRIWLDELLDRRALGARRRRARVDDPSLVGLGLVAGKIAVGVHDRLRLALLAHVVVAALQRLASASSVEAARLPYTMRASGWATGGKNWSTMSSAAW